MANDEFDPDEPLEEDLEVDEKAEKKKAKKKARKAKATEQLKYKAVLDTYQGRELIWDILSHSKVFQQSYVADDQGGRKSAFNEGRRHEGMWLMANVFTYYPESYSLMQQEATDREEAAKK